MPSARKGLRTYSNSSCTTLATKFTIGDTVYIDGEITAKLATTSTTVLIQVYDSTPTLKATPLDKTHNFTSNTVTSIKNAINGGTAPSFSTVGFTEGIYDIKLTVSGTSVETTYEYESIYVSAQAKATITSVSFVDNTVTHDEGMQINLEMTNTDYAVVIFKNIIDEVVYAGVFDILSATTARCIIPAWSIPEGEYGAGQILVMAFDDVGTYALDTSLTAVISTPAYGMTKWFRQSVTIEPADILDIYGKYTFATGRVYSCRIVEKTQKIMNATGETVLSHAVIYLSPSVSVTINDRITMPDTTQPRIINITKHYDALGNHKITAVYV